MKYIIDFDDNLTLAEVEQYLIENNITKLKQFGTFGNVFLIETNNELALNSKILSAVRDDDQSIVLLSTEIELIDRGVATSFDIEDTKNWWKVASINKIDFDVQTHNHMTRGNNSTVYIIDSGITMDHPEFTNVTITLLHSFNDNFIDNKGHGTALASLVVGSTCALSNPGLKVVKLFDNVQPTYQSDMIGALDAVYADYVSNGKKPSVVNMSWSIPKNEYINSKIQTMINDGMFIVAASGNSGQPIGDVTPASIPDVLTIGSFNQNLEPSSFSNYTSGSDISYTASDVNHGALDGWAPGEMIWSANKNGSYGYIAGTSAAAAIASAAFAYNLDTILDDSGYVTDNLRMLHNNKLVYYNNITLSRSGLLDLSDTKYQESVNKMVTYITSPKSGAIRHLKYVKAGDTTSTYLFNPTRTKIVSYESLPSFINVSDRGFLIVSYPEIGSLVEKNIEIEFNIVNRDNSNDIAIVEIVAWNQNYSNIEEIRLTSPDTMNDPVLDYILLYGPGSCIASGGCIEDGCSDFSGGAVACFEDKNIPCQCT